jgi:hypothetical protein
MSHWAEIDENNIVIRVLVGDNDDPYGDEGGAKLKAILGGNWVQTSYSAGFRKNFAAIGYKYDEDLDAFIPPQLFPSWTLDTEECVWKPPTPYPADQPLHVWSEAQLAWVPVIVEENSGA